MVFATAFRHIQTAISRLVRFGKAVFRSVCEKLQAENDVVMSFSCDSPVFIGWDRLKF